MMLSPWFAFALASTQRGWEAQSAFISSLMRLFHSGAPEPSEQIHVIERGDGSPSDHQPPAQAPPASVAVRRREKAANRSERKDKIVKSKARQLPKRPAASASRPAKALRAGRKGR